MSLIELATIIRLLVGIIAGVAQILDYLEKRRAKQRPVITPERNSATAEKQRDSAIFSNLRSRTFLWGAAVLVLLLLGASFYWLSSRDRAIDSLAVLPFVNASADPNMDYLSDGITEEMINNLSQLSNLRVVPSSSVFRYVKPNSIAQVYLALGDKDQAIAWLQKAEEEHNDYLTLLKVHPGFDHLRTDPRFLEGV